MAIEKFAQVNGIICFVIGMVLNSLLIVLICKNRSTSSDKSYKPIVLQICITDMLNLILFTFYMPAFVSAGNYIIFYTHGFFNDAFENAPLFTHIIYRAWYCFNLLFIFSPSVQFLYRYLILCRHWKPSYALYTGFYSLIVLLFVFYTILINGTVIYASRTSNALYRENIFTDNPINVDLVVQRLDSPNPWPTMLAGIIAATAISIVVICGIRIWLHFRRHFKVASNTSKSSQRLQRQVNYALFIQGGMPVIGNFAVLILEIFLNMEAEYMSYLLTFFPLVIMIVNPLLTILLVDSYRRAALNLFLRKSAKFNVSTVTIVQSVKMSHL